MHRNNPGLPHPVHAMLASRPVSHIEWGLERTQEMLISVGNPERCFRSVHVAGTNGKGSVAASLAEVLSAQGYRTGLYTSPHLVDFRERIQVAGRPVRDSLLEASAAALRPHADRTGATYFEVATALGFLCFAAEEVEVAVVETGLGGRLDATNVVRPDVCAITSLSLDHTGYLGTGLAEIAAEKAGILKPGVPAAVAKVPEAARDVILESARRVAAPVRLMGRDARVEDVQVTLDGTRFTYFSPACPRGQLTRTPLIGPHQAENAGLARLALEQLAGPPGEEAMLRGLERVRMPGRFQVIQGNRGRWVLDIAHNEAAAACLMDTLARVEVPKPRIGLVSILADKPWREILAILTSDLDGLVLTVAPSSPPDRRWDLAEAVHAGRTPGTVAALELEDAMKKARELAGDGTVVVTGSAHTVGDVLGRLGELEAV